MFPACHVYFNFKCKLYDKMCSTSINCVPSHVFFHFSFMLFICENILMIICNLQD